MMDKIRQRFGMFLSQGCGLAGLFIIELVGSLSVLSYYPSFEALMGCLSLSALIAVICSAIIGLLPWRSISAKVVYWCVAVTLGALSATDIYVFMSFQKPFDQDIIDIICETNPDEVSAFVDAYFSWWLVLLIMVVTVGVCYGVYRLLRGLRIKVRKGLNIAILVLSVIGVGYLSVGAYSFVRYGNGMAIPQYTNLTRIMHDIRIVKGRMDAIKSLTALCADVKAENISAQPDSTLYVVIIGESLSKYHCSLYGYGQKTNPRLEQRHDSGELCVFDDAVCIDDHTHTVLKSIFSFSRCNDGFECSPLFPAVFKKAGYYTALYDNQYFVDRGVSFLNNRDLSDIMFDYRNGDGYSYDGEMLAEISVPALPALIVVHLMGQHYTYADRYPEGFTRFTPEEYQKFTEDQCAIISHYDNSVCYNDSIVDALLERLNDRICCVIYFSDHGEELYEFGDFMGHGNAAHSDGIEHQIRVPMMIWGSDSFRQTDMWSKIMDASGKKISTDDIAHVLMDLAGISTAAFDPKRSFLNDEFADTHRTVLKSIDIDALQ